MGTLGQPEGTGPPGPPSTPAPAPPPASSGLGLLEALAQARAAAPADLTALGVPLAAAFAIAETAGKLIPEGAETPLLRAPVWKGLLAPLVVVLLLVAAAGTGRTNPFKADSPRFGRSSRFFALLLAVLVGLLAANSALRGSREKFFDAAGADVAGLFEVDRAERKQCPTRVGDAPVCSDPALLGVRIAVYPAPGSKGFVQVCPTAPGLLVESIPCSTSGGDLAAPNDSDCREIEVPERSAALIACVRASPAAAAALRAQADGLRGTVAITNRVDRESRTRPFALQELSRWQRHLLQ